LQIADVRKWKAEIRHQTSAVDTADSKYMYICLQLFKMTDARVSHINAKQGTIKAQNTIKQDQLTKESNAIRCFKCYDVLDGMFQI
jgi:hypothetical protein